MKNLEKLENLKLENKKLSDIFGGSFLVGETLHQLQEGKQQYKTGRLQVGAQLQSILVILE